MMTVEHKLARDTLDVTADGIVATCICGWKSRPYFSSIAASATFNDHLEEIMKQKATKEVG